MAAGLRGHAGGIQGLLELIASHKEAVEYDLLALGLRLAWLGTPALTWRDLLVIVRQSPPGCAVHRALDPDTWRWGLSEQLLALNADYAAIAAWQRSGDSKAPRPDPLPRTDEVAPAPETGVSLEEANRRLGWDMPMEGASS